MNAIQKRRFKRLIQIVAKVPKKLFQMDCYIEKTKCGTVGCAVGWYKLKSPRAAIDLPSERFSRDATAKHFGIEPFEVLGMFVPSYGAPKDKRKVLKLLRGFLADVS